MEEDFIPMYDDMNQGIAPLVNEPINFNTPNEIVLPAPRQVLGNVIKNQAIEYAGKKLGINQLGQVLGLGQYLGNVFGLGLNPLGVGIGALAGGIRERFNAYRQNKRDERARAEVAARGLAKQRAAALQAMKSNQAYSGDGGGGISNAQAAANREGRRGGQYG